MTDDKLTAESAAENVIRDFCVSLEPSNIPLSLRQRIQYEMVKFGDQRAAEATKEFHGITCTCQDGPCGSGICVSSTMASGLAEARRMALEEAANHLELLSGTPGIGEVTALNYGNAANRIRQLADKGK